MSTTRRLALPLALALLVAAPSAAQAALPTPLGCLDFSNNPEQTQNYSPLQGSSDLNAQTGNGALMAGLSSEGTLNVLRWPTPSSYDQVKHFSPEANLPRAGAEPNMGAFLGMVVGGRTTWLRDLPATQRYRKGDSDTVVTTYRDTARAITVTVESVVAHGLDVLTHRVTVAAAGSLRPTSLVAFENFNLTVLYIPSVPFGDWCEESLGIDKARYDGGSGAIVHSRSGYDLSRQAPQSVAMAMATGSKPSAHQVGSDEHEIDGLIGPKDAYADAADGRLGGNDGWTGSTTGALTVPLSYRRGKATEEVFVGAAHDPGGAVANVERARRAGMTNLATGKERWLRSRLAKAKMPAVPDPRETALARRALILLATSQAESGAIVASIATQPTYAQDWPRDGAYLQEAMDQAGLHDQARKHGLFLARTQASPTHVPLGGLAVPIGAWPMNMYDTGASGGPIPFEFDEVGFGAWSMWAHYTHTHDRSYLEQVWPAIRRSAELLVSCRDPEKALQCRNTEDDSIALLQQQTIGAAMTTFSGLGAAEQAARVLGRSADADRYAARRRELVGAVDKHLWEEPGGHYGGIKEEGIRKLGTYVFWPERPRGLEAARVARHAQWLWSTFAPSFEAPKPGGRTFGFYDGLAILGLGEWARTNDRTLLPGLKRGLSWIAHVQATSGTGLLGENWRVRNGRVQTITAVPQLWEHSLFYLASLAVYGERKPCKARKAFVVRAKGRILGATLRGPKGKRLRKLKPAGRRVRVNLRGLAGPKVTLRLRIRTGGKVRTVSRRYAVCAKR